MIGDRMKLTERSFVLICRLAKNRFPMRKYDMNEILSVDRRTVCRMVSNLKKMGVPIVETMNDNNHAMISLNQTDVSMWMLD